MGLGSKLNFQFDHPGWEPTSDGESYSDLSPGGTFPAQVGLPGVQGINVALTIHDYGGAAAHEAASTEVIADTVEAPVETDHELFS